MLERLNTPVVNAPVLAVVAPTVPLMFMLAVPVKLVTVPLAGVPSAPPSYSNVALALGNVKVFSLLAGPLNFVNPFPVPPDVPAIGVVAVTVVKAPVAAVVAPTVPLKAPLLNVPPVIVLPVKVSADGRDSVVVPDTVVAVISFAVPTTDTMTLDIGVEFQLVPSHVHVRPLAV